MLWQSDPFYTIAMTLTTTTALQINQVLRQGSLILISILLAKSGLPMTDIGIYESLIFVGTTMTFFWINALTQGILAFFSTNTYRTSRINQEGEAGNTRFNIFLIFNFLNIGLFIILLFFKSSILSLLIGKPDLPHFNLYIFYILINLPPLALESFWTIDNKPYHIIAYAFISHIGLPLAMIIPIWLGYDLATSICAMIGIATIRYTWLIINVLQLEKWQIDITLMRSFLRLCTPLMGYFILAGLSTAFSGWLINWYYQSNLDTFVIYRFGAREFPLSLALLMGLSNAVVPLLVSNDEKNTLNTEGVLYLKKKSLQLWHWLFPISILLMIFSKGLFGLIFNPNFVASAAVFNVFLMFLIVRALFPQSIVLVLKETKVMLWISLCETFLIIILCSILVFPFGMIGVAWGIFIGYLFEKIALIIFLQKKYHIAWSSYTNTKWFWLYSLFLIITYCLSIIYI
jgi:hypothetical protein